MRRFEIIEKYKDKAIMPKRATKNSAGYDLSSIEDVLINPGEIKLIPTGLKVKIPHDEALFVFPRSSLAFKKGVMMSNGVGVVDADYYGNEENEGHLMVPLYNFTNKPTKILAGERIAQGIFMNYKVTSDDPMDQDKRSGGFGSSGL